MEESLLKVRSRRGPISSNAIEMPSKTADHAQRGEEITKRPKADDASESANRSASCPNRVFSSAECPTV